MRGLVVVGVEEIGLPEKADGPVGYLPGFWERGKDKIIGKTTLSTGFQFNLFGYARLERLPHDRLDGGIKKYD